MSREAMQLALEALEKVITAFGSGLTLQQNAITALRQALVDADDTSQERVDEMVKTEHDRAVELGKAYERGWNAALAQREWVPEALRLADALDAEFVQGRISNHNGRKAAVELRRLHEALETEQEPVAWISEGGDVSRSKRYMDEMGFKCNPLYTSPQKRELTCVCGAVWEGETMVHPPRKREWVGLTHPQIHELDWPDGVSFEDILLFVRAIEQALKEKNA